MDFDRLNNVHIPAAIVKSFLRQLPEPLLTYDLYDHIIHVQCEQAFSHCHPAVLQSTIQSIMDVSDHMTALNAGCKKRPLTFLSNVMQPCYRPHYASCLSICLSRHMLLTGEFTRICGNAKIEMIIPEGQSHRCTSFKLTRC